MRRPGLDDFVWDNAERGENRKIKRSTRFMSASRELYFERKLRIFPELLNYQLDSARGKISRGGYGDYKKWI